MESSPKRGPEGSRPNIALLSILAVLCALIVVAGVFFARSQRRSMEASIAGQLSAIADLKVQQIRAWRRERLADAVLLASDPLVLLPANAQNQSRLQGWLESFRKLYGYSEVAIVDRDGRALNVALQDAAPNDPNLGSLISAAVLSREPKVSDLESGPLASVFLDFVAPILSEQGASGGRAVVLRVEASAFLDGIVQSWPIPGPTAECLLVRQEGRRVRYLNEPRHTKQTPLEM